MSLEFFLSQAKILNFLSVEGRASGTTQSVTLTILSSLQPFLVFSSRLFEMVVCILNEIKHPSNSFFVPVTVYPVIIYKEITTNKAKEDKQFEAN